MNYDLIVIMDETYPVRPKNIIEKMLKVMIRKKMTVLLQLKKKQEIFCLKTKIKLKSLIILCLQT